MDQTDTHPYGCSLQSRYARRGDLAFITVGIIQEVQ